MKFREHRGGLAESMETCVGLTGRKALEMHVRAIIAEWPGSPVPVSIQVEPCFGPDKRTGWKETWIVTAAGCGVVGFTDGEPK